MELRAAVLVVNIALTTLSAAFPLDVELSDEEYVFLQKLDHFNPDNHDYFRQRYYKYDFNSYDGAPIFLDIGGESPRNGISGGFVFDTAIKSNGIIFSLEHRYYGGSVPDSYFYGRPTYLTSEQALADIAYFIEVQKEQYPHSPWIVSGCSYAGNLATWMRLKYPHLVTGAIAGSAPVLAKVDFYEYFEVVGEVLKKRAPQCHQKLVEANQEFTTLAKTVRGQSKLASMFRFPLYLPLLGNALHGFLAKEMSTVNGTDMQYLKYYQPYHSELCDLITRNTGGKSTLEILINEFLSRLTTNTLESIITRNFDIGFLNRSALDDSMWTYQTCNEFGYLQTLSSKKHPFGVWPNVDDLAQRCKEWNIDLETVEKNVRKTNLRYGGKTPNVTNVVFMYGSNDPWHPLGVLRDLSSSARAFIFQGMSHCECDYGREAFKAVDERLPQWMNMLDEIESIVRSWF